MQERHLLIVQHPGFCLDHLALQEKRVAAVVVYAFLSGGIVGALVLTETQIVNGREQQIQLAVLLNLEGDILGRPISARQ